MAVRIRLPQPTNRSTARNSIDAEEPAVGAADSNPSRKAWARGRRALLLRRRRLRNDLQPAAGALLHVGVIGLRQPSGTGRGPGEVGWKAGRIGGGSRGGGAPGGVVVRYGSLSTGKLAGMTSHEHVGSSGKKSKAPEKAGKPGPVPRAGCPARGDGHFSRTPVARRLKRPNPRARAGHPIALLFGLAPGGVCRAGAVTRAAGELLPHRFTLTALASGGLLSVALVRAVARPGR